MVGLISAFLIIVLILSDLAGLGDYTHWPIAIVFVILTALVIASQRGGI